MKKIRSFVTAKAKKHGKKFSLFTSVGVYKTVQSIFLSWLFIDFLKIWALLGSAMVVGIGIITTYYIYVKIRLINPSFIKFSSATMGVNLLRIVLVWVLVDFAGFTGAISTAIVIGLLTLLRYALFDRMGLIKYD